MRVRPALVAVCLASSLLVAPVAGAEVPDELEQAEAEEQVISERLDAALAEAEELEAQVALTVNRLERLDDEVREARRAAAEAAQRVEDRVRAMFMSPQPPPVLQAMTGTVGETGDRLEAVSVLNQREDALIEEAEATQLEAVQAEQLLVEEREAYAARLAEREQSTAVLQDELERASRLVGDLRSRAERQQQVERGAQQGVYACIFEPDATTFIDSWGYPRSGGRSHKGTDVMAARSEPVYAFTSGTIDRLKTGGLGGIVAYLEGDDGVRYYYAHLERYADGLAVGQRVEAGELIAFNGDSGNARGGATHVHFQVDPGGGPVNPYPWLTAVC